MIELTNNEKLEIRTAIAKDLEESKKLSKSKNLTKSTRDYFKVKYKTLLSAQEKIRKLW